MRKGIHSIQAKKTLYLYPIFEPRFRRAPMTRALPNKQDEKVNVSSLAWTNDRVTGSTPTVRQDGRAR